MRTLMYKVRNNEGYEFTTTSYAEATKKENHLISTFLVKDETEDEKLAATRKKHAHKIMEKFGIKRG
jgi:hypothetical protein